MKIRTGCSSSGAQLRDYLTAHYGVFVTHEVALIMSIHSDVAAKMLQNYRITITVQTPDEDHGSIVGRPDSSTSSCRDVDAIVHYPISHAERRRDQADRNRPRKLPISSHHRPGG